MKKSTLDNYMYLADRDTLELMQTYITPAKDRRLQRRALGTIRANRKIKDPNYGAKK